MSEKDSERKPGGQPNNTNAVKVPKTELGKLDTPEDILAAQKQVIQALYSGDIGGRQAGAINHGLETLLKFHLDSKKLAEYEVYFQRIKNLLDKQENKGESD